MNYNVDVPYQIKTTKGSTRKTVGYHERKIAFQSLIESLRTN